MEAAIEEALLGAKTSISPIILSLEHETNFKVARETLEAFYLAHKSQLSAAYCISGNIKGNRTLKIVSGDDLDVKKSEFQDATAILYAVAPANATDPVVLSGLARRKTEMVLRLTNDQLRKTGRILNPLNTDTGQRATTVSPSPSASTTPVPDVATLAPIEQATPNTVLNAAEALKATETKSKPPIKADSAKYSSKAASKPNNLSSFFTKGTRENAIEFVKRDTPLKPISTVVEAMDYDQEGDEPLVEPSAKKQQLENLKEMFDPNEEGGYSKISDVEDEEDQDIDVVGEPVDATEPEAIEMEDQDMDVQEEAEDEIQEEPQEKIKEMIREEAADADVPMAGQECEEFSNASQDSGSKVPTEPTETELDDGWSVTEIAAPEKPKSMTMTAKPAAEEPKNNQSQLNLPKIPAKPQKKQSTLTSFFNKR